MTLTPGEQEIVARGLASLGVLHDRDDRRAIVYAAVLVLEGRPTKQGLVPLDDGDKAFMLDAIRRRTPKPTTV